MGRIEPPTTLEADSFVHETVSNHRYSCSLPPSDICSWSLFISLSLRFLFSSPRVRGLCACHVSAVKTGCAEVPMGTTKLGNKEQELCRVIMVDWGRCRGGRGGVRKGGGRGSGPAGKKGGKPNRPGKARRAAMKGGR